MHVLLHTVLLWHTLQCVCVCVCVCASVESTQWDTMASHYIKSPMELYDVCIEDQSYGDKHDVCTSYGACGYMHMYLCAFKGGSTENQSRGNSTCMESCQRNIVSFTQCVHVHKSARVTLRACSYILL